MTALWQDVRYGFRTLLQAPGFTAVAVLTLALGIGANSAIFSVVHAVLLEPLPYEQPERIVMVWERLLKRGVNSSATAPNFADWRERNEVFVNLAGWRGQSFTLTGVDQPERIPGVLASAALFPLLGTEAKLGRTFLPEEEQPGRHRVVVLGHGLWQRRFGANPGIVGTAVTLNAEPYTVVGVMPEGFQFPAGVDLWTPLALDARQLSFTGSHVIQVAGRLQPGMTLEQAQAGMNALARRIEPKRPNSNSGWGVVLVPLQEQMVSGVRQGLWILLGAVGFVLLIACANVANLLLTRAAARGREVAIRAALGAGRWRLVRQLLTESVLLALLGGSLGLLLSLWGMETLVRFAPAGLPRIGEVRMNGWVLGFTALAALLTGALFGLAPALRASRAELTGSLRGTLAARSRVPVSGFLVVSETALALMLLIGAGLLIRSFARLQVVRPGFDPRGVLTAQIDLYGDVPRQAAFWHDVLERVAGLPGIRAAGVVSGLPLAGPHRNMVVTIEGRPPVELSQMPFAFYKVASPDYFRALGVPLLRGRPFTERDLPGAPRVMLINDTMARRYWSGEDPVGKRLRLDNGEPGWVEVVGILGDVRQLGLESEPGAEMYIPFRQVPASFFPAMTLVLRAAGVPPESLMAAVTGEAQKLDPNAPVYNLRTMDEILARSMASRRFSLGLLGLFAGIAMGLAAVGIYGVMAYSVSRRTHEIGIRMALGAQGGDVLRLVVVESLGLTLGGIALGMAGAWALTRLLAGGLYGVSPTDPATFLVVALLLAAVALLASYLPARRASRVDPLTALRYE